MTDIPPPAAIRTLPVWRTVGEAYRLVFRQWRLLVKAITIPFALMILFAIGLREIRLPEVLWIAYYFLPTILLLVPYTIFGVAWHRLTLLGPHGGSPPWIPAWKRRHTIFFFLACVVTLIYYALIFLIVEMNPGAFLYMIEGFGIYQSNYLSHFLSLLMVIILILFFCAALKLSFIFPATAVDVRYSLRMAWRHSRKQGLRLLLVAAATTIPVEIAIEVLMDAIGGGSLSGDLKVVSVNGEPVDIPIETDFETVSGYLSLFRGFVVEPILTFVSVALVVSAISIAFRTCTGWVPAEGESGTPAMDKAGGIS